MSDMIQQGAPAPRPGQGMPPGGDVKSKMSVFNPTDMASKVSKGDIRQGQSVGEFLQRNFGVSPQDPVKKLFASLKGQAKNATVPGKMGMPSPQGPKPGAPPGGRPQGPPGGMPPGGQPQPMRGMDDLIKRM